MSNEIKLASYRVEAGVDAIRLNINYQDDEGGAMVVMTPQAAMSMAQMLMGFALDARQGYQPMAANFMCEPFLI